MIALPLILILALCVAGAFAPRSRFDYEDDKWGS